MAQDRQLQVGAVAAAVGDHRIADVAGRIGIDRRRIGEGVGARQRAGRQRADQAAARCRAARGQRAGQAWSPLSVSVSVTASVVAELATVTVSV